MAGVVCKALLCAVSPLLIYRLRERNCPSGTQYMSERIIECPRCSTTMRPADKNVGSGLYVCYECGMEFIPIEGEPPGECPTRFVESHFDSRISGRAGGLVGM